MLYLQFKFINYTGYIRIELNKIMKKEVKEVGLHKKAFSEAEELIVKREMFRIL